MKFKKIIIYEKHKIFKNALYGQTRNESKKCPIDLFLWLVQTGTPLPLPSRILQFLIHKYFPTTTQNQLIFLDVRVRVEFRCCAFFVQHLLILIIKIYMYYNTYGKLSKIFLKCWFWLFIFFFSDMEHRVCLFRNWPRQSLKWWATQSRLCETPPSTRWSKCIGTSEIGSGQIYRRSSLFLFLS